MTSRQCIRDRAHQTVKARSERETNMNLGWLPFWSHRIMAKYCIHCYLNTINQKYTNLRSYIKNIPSLRPRSDYQLNCGLANCDCNYPNHRLIHPSFPIAFFMCKKPKASTFFLTTVPRYPETRKIVVTEKANKQGPTVI